MKQSFSLCIKVDKANADESNIFIPLTPVTIVSEGDLRWYEVSTALQIHRDVSAIHLMKRIIKNENDIYNWLHIMQDDLVPSVLSCSSIHALVSEGDKLFSEAICSYKSIRVQSFVAIVTVHKFNSNTNIEVDTAVSLPVTLLKAKGANCG